KDEIDGTWAVRPLDLLLDPGRTALVLDDPGGELLSGLVCAPMETGGLLREWAPPDPPEIIAGTFPYMAPEQTGRMNRSIDSRSDLYSFGVTWYEMLTGPLPFSPSSPLEWIHCHVARQPVPVAERVNGIPDSISAIVSKLMSKNAEDRYQTAVGVELDLRRCLKEWESH